MLPESLIPEALSVFSFWMLVGVSFFGSFLSTAAGIGGGVTLLAVMAQVMPPLALIPCHGVVQAGSNMSRMALFFKHIDWKFMRWFVLGSLIGVAVASQLVIALPVALLQIMLGIFILYSVWGPKPGSVAVSSKGIVVGGALTTFGSMFVGATGPFVMAFVAPFKYDRLTKVGTFSSVMVTQHTLKIIMFSFLGFAFVAYVPLLALMVGAGFLGTLVGKRVLMKQSEAHFSYILNIILTLLALRLLWQAFESYL
ncbi:sulfite exporter TauE/SafE family protein [Kordiimonas aquimaris]|uniref:sulfite exporter TauE/SafE family protein n=1 Tax=Kordiimonas aquimaris TaxID=707591 RepID=UPI0021CE1D5F|nr:sulfite exporter TauE/SafE family protein [Kordiimonas aquimaris]